MSQIATDQIEAAIRKAGNTHPKPRKSKPPPCQECVYRTIDEKGVRRYSAACRECCHFYSSQFERRTT